MIAEIAGSRMKSYVKALLAGASLTLWANVSGAETLEFSVENILTWPNREFSGETDYRQVRWGNEPVLQTRARGQASAKYLERKIDLRVTPYLRWCWRVSSIYPGLEETTKAGDDYPARVYVVHKTGLLPFQVQSVNYVWSGSQAQGANWPNAFTERAHLLALRAGEAQVGEWVVEVRHVPRDFATFFGASVQTLEGIALMSDGDNAGGDATAWFARLGFSSSPEAPSCPNGRQRPERDR